jgi:hypothetical protein
VFCESCFATATDGPWRNEVFRLLRDLKGAVSVSRMIDRGRPINPSVKLEINPWFNPEADDRQALEADHHGHDN